MIEAKILKYSGNESVIRIECNTEEEIQEVKKKLIEAGIKVRDCRTPRF